MMMNRFRAVGVLVLVLLGSSQAFAADGDGDGVDDAIDVCCQTPTGVAVDAEGRPVGDLDGDCDTDLNDYALFQRGFTGPLTGCCDNADCPPQQYCSTEAGACGQPGVCVAVPTDCAAVYIPVCGCDGQTYSNDCYAAAAGVSVDYEGVCANGPCTTNDDCNPGDYCNVGVGNCNGSGTCAEIPSHCVNVYVPVCGCDGQTYGNDCFAAQAGVSVDYAGECATTSCTSNQDCLSTQYCSTGAGACGGSGECVDRPIACPDIWDPVCGCDGQTYGNACEAAMSGINVDFAGVCPQPTCTSNFECEATEYCANGVGNCGGIGACETKPLACPAIWDPVCGCDGETYGSACDAALAGMNVDYAGVCQPPACTTNGECETGDYCQKTAGDCNGIGACAAMPEVCPGVFAPVCGCNFQTYQNACFAAQSGINVITNGACE
jgi:hypothetical protein